MPSDSVLARIRMVLLDVDGVLTDGRIHFDQSGVEYKTFHVHDAAGLVYWHRAGGLSGFLSGRGGPIVERRAAELGVHEVMLSRLDKATAFKEVLERQKLQPDEIAYMGDDLLDLPVLKQVGLAATVPQGRPEVRAQAHFVTPSDAGFGAARDLVELLLRAKGVWSDVVDKEGRP